MPLTVNRQLKTYSGSHVWVNKNGKKQRYYQIQETGKHYPGVTTILNQTKPEHDKLQLNLWRQRVGYSEATRITQDACNRGTIVHSQIESTLKQETFTPNDKVSGFWDSISPVLSHVSDPFLIEGCIYHSSWLYAGTVDCVAHWDGIPCILDWKTASRAKKPEWIEDYKIQVAGYCGAVNRLYGLRINLGVIAIALDGLPAQVFKIEGEDMLKYWQLWTNRVIQYYQGV